MSSNVLVVGSGFMGTSIALGLSNRKISCVEPNLEYKNVLEEQNIYDEIFSNAEKVIGVFALVVICTRQIDAYKNIKYFCKKFPDALVTDIASSKRFLINQDLPNNFISSHPICGSHKVGPANAEADLFKRKEVIILSDTVNERVPVLKNFWHELGANTSEMNFEDHDRYYAYLSHFPHLFSFIYKELLDEEGIDYLKYSGDSMKEILRLSEADRALWNEIFADNKNNLDALKEKIKKKLL